jgi:hypothetical protein
MATELVCFDMLCMYACFQTLCTGLKVTGGSEAGKEDRKEEEVGSVNTRGVEG